MPLWLPSIVSDPLPALPIVSVPAFIHSPPLTSTVPWALASWPMSALPFDRLAATPKRLSVPDPASPTTTIPLAVICSRFTTVPAPVACAPSTRAFEADEPVSASAPPITTISPDPALPTMAACWAVTTAPPASASVPPPSTLTATPPLPLAVTWPVSMVLPPETTIWVTVPPVGMVGDAGGRNRMMPWARVAELVSSVRLARSLPDRV